MQRTKHKIRTYPAALPLALLFMAGTTWAQQAAPASPAAETPADEDVIVLTPFEVSAESETGYSAATTLAGNRLNTDLRDIGNAVSVITSQFLRDVGATNNETLLQYTTGTEVGNVYGNFAGTGDGAVLDESSKFTNPNQNTRVRGLTAADNTRDFFLTDIPWDGYNVDRVDMQRGANSILFGQGSPAGIINTGSKQASFKDANQFVARYGSFGSARTSLDLNKVLIKGELAIRIAGLYNDEKYKQEPAYTRDKRIYGATRWEPGFLKKGSARTVFRANYEAGEVRSNRPRSIPPIDNMTPWFLTGTYTGKDVGGNPMTYKNLNRETFIPSQLQDDNTGLPNHGQMRPSYNGGPNGGQPNQAYNPWLGNFAQQFGGPLAYFDASSAAPAKYWVQEPQTSLGIGSDGAIDKGIGGMPFQRPASITPYQQFAKNAHIPYSEFGIYKDRSLTDPSIFDFYNNLLDGPNKREWQNFTHYTLGLSQTFFDDQVGFDISYNKEKYNNGQISLLSGEKQAIYIDVNRVYADGTGEGKDGEPFGDGTPNPNVGRPFVSDSGQFSNNSYSSDRENARATAFVTHDFTRGGNNAWWARALGQHTITGLIGKDRQVTDQRNWQLYGTDAAYQTFVNLPNAKFTDNALTPNNVIYLGKSLINSPTAVGAHIPRIQNILMPASGTVHAFDGRWNKPTDPTKPGYVDPAAPWTNNYNPEFYPGTTTPITGRNSTQSENPANYVGWRDVPMKVIRSEEGNRDFLTTSARLTKSVVSSKVAVWQAHFWDNALVGTYGIRKDIAKSWGKSIDTNSSSSDAQGHLNLGPSNYFLPNDPLNRIEVTSKSWSAVAHLTQFIGDKSPIRVSLFYSKSENFQPAAQRVDLYGTPLAAPSGSTTDRGILLETRDNKYTLKINKYETKALNASSNALGGTWFIGTSQAWAGNWVNHFEFNQTGDTIDTVVPDPKGSDPTDGGYTQYNYGQAPGETIADAQAREKSVIAAWRAWQKSVDPRFYTAWKINLNDRTKSISASNPQGFTVTEDSISKGYEIELSALPVKNWRLTMNATKTDAIRTNIGGTALGEFITAYEKALNTGKGGVGDLRIWWGGAGNETTLQQWNSNIGSEYAQRKLQEGTNVPELREWRFNGISTYSFDHGLLKGVDVGGGVRYESDIVIGYKPIPGAQAGRISFDLASPYKGPAETNFDFWVGYNRKLSKNLSWNIQLNVRNAFVGNELIPVNVQPDGSAAGYRIRPPQTWTLTNTFNF